MGSEIDWEFFLLETQVKAAMARLPSLLPTPRGIWRKLAWSSVEELEGRHENDPAFREKIHSLGHRKES